MVAKSGHMTITKIKNLHIDTHIKFTDSKKLFFLIYDEKIMKLLQKNRFRTVAWHDSQALGHLELTLVFSTSL